MQAFGVLLLAAATAGDGFGYSDPGVGLKKWLRPHAVVSADAPGPPPIPRAGMGGQGGPWARRRPPVRQHRSQIYFLDPDGMQIGWQTPPAPTANGSISPAQLTVPARYNFNQGYIYRLKLTDIPGRADACICTRRSRSPRRTPATDAYLAHNADPDPVHRRGLRPGHRRRQLRDQGHLPARSAVPGAGRLGRRDAGLDPARAGHRPDPRGRQAGHDPADRPAGCHRPGDARRRSVLGGGRPGRRCRTVAARDVMTSPDGRWTDHRAAAGRLPPGVDPGTCPGRNRDPRPHDAQAGAPPPAMIRPAPDPVDPASSGGSEARRCAGGPQARPAEAAPADALSPRPRSPRRRSRPPVPAPAPVRPGRELRS